MACSAASRRSNAHPPIHRASHRSGSQVGCRQSCAGLKPMERAMTDRKQQYKTAIHEAGHAVVGHLVGVEIDHVAITGPLSGYSRPVRRPKSAIADKLWATANSISRKIVRTGWYRGGKH